MRTAPWVREITARYKEQGLAAVGIHTPEFDYERSRDEVAAHATKLGLDFPHLVDPDFEYWKKLQNQYWPTVYLVDRCGRLRHRQVGEVHLDQTTGRRVEGRIQELLRESAQCRQ